MACAFGVLMHCFATQRFFTLYSFHFAPIDKQTHVYYLNMITSHVFRFVSHANLNCPLSYFQQIYIQKVKRLEYEHRNNVQAATEEGQKLLEAEAKSNKDEKAALNTKKAELQKLIKKLEANNEDEIKAVKDMQVKEINQIRKDFDKCAGEMQRRFEQRLADLRDDLELRRKVCTLQNAALVVSSCAHHCSALCNFFVFFELCISNAM